jgi:hypothetical protein
MKTLIRLYVGALALAASVASPLPAAPLQPPRQTGHVLLLENERVVEGTIDREGDAYHVRRPVGETVVPDRVVLCLCENMEEAYDFLRARANLRDPDERIRLARWCHLHGLRGQAVEEASAAVALRPDHAEGRRLLQSFQKSATVTPAPAPATPRPAASRPDVKAPEEPAIEVNAEALGQFITKVQPILMNTCASCHMSGQAGSFRLTRSLEGGLVNRRATQHNLSAVLAQINKEHWEGSPFLVKAVNIHGQASQPPLKSRQVPAFRNLEDWVRVIMVNNNSAVADRTPVGTMVAASMEAKAPVEGARGETSFGAIVTSPRPAQPAGNTPTTGNQPATAATIPEKMPAILAEPVPVKGVDPFDPALFNQQGQPRGQ